MVIKPLTTIVDHGQPVDARTGNLPIVRQPETPFREPLLQGSALTMENLARKFHELHRATHDVTQGIRQMPEGNPRTYFKSVPFVSGTPKTLSHLLGVSTPATGQYTQSAAAVASDPTQIRFEVLNHVGAFGGCYRSAIDARTITLVPSATFTADVRLFVVA